MIRELQHLRAVKQVPFSAEVTELMSAVMRERARRKDAATYQFWRRWLPADTIRRDDAILASDLYLLQATLIEHMEPEELKIRIAGFRDMLSHLLTKASYDAWSGQFRKLSDDAGSTSSLQAEARAITSEMYRRYEGVPAVESARKWAAVKILVMTAGIVLACAIKPADHLVPILAVAVAGSIGAALSTVERLYRLDPREDPFKMSLTLDSAGLTLVLAPVLGAIFALVLFIIFRAGLLRGIVFPQFADNCWSFLSFSANVDTMCAESRAKDMAMLIAWGFLAGWAERLVPDVLDKLAPKVSADARTKLK